ncbi:Threonine aldolase [Phlyctochytrium planicorne]|nr:Threonine aldolase [Phlyctochytrium planicorne]
MTLYQNESPTAASGDVFDFRSDTFTKPTKAMREAMLNADVGDDVFGEDPTINKLHEYICELTGAEAALFCTSATMTNQLAIKCLLELPPYSVLCDRRAHVYSYEAGGISFHNGASVIPVDPKPGFSHLTADVVEKFMVISDDVHHCPTKLICLENTLGGEVFPLEEIRKIVDLAKKNGLKLHLDGSRLWNASIATGIPLKELVQGFDTVTLCLSKGLGAPVGSVLIGSAATIKRAKHFRKMFGGGWRQAGILAAGALYAIENHWPQMSTDHENAKLLAQGFEKLGFKLTKRCDTNMVWLDGSALGVTANELRDALKPHNVLIFGGGAESRWVVHHQVNRKGVELALSVVQQFLVARNA